MFDYYRFKPPQTALKLFGVVKLFSTYRFYVAVQIPLAAVPTFRVIFPCDCCIPNAYRDPELNLFNVVQGISEQVGGAHGGLRQLHEPTQRDALPTGGEDLTIGQKNQI